MVQLCGKLDIEFANVRFGKYSVQLIISDALRLFIQVEDHGSRLDLVVLYKHDDAGACEWLPQVVEVFELAVRLQLWRSGCTLTAVDESDPSDFVDSMNGPFGGGNGGSADDDERKVEHSVKPMLRSSSSAKFCCHFHHLSSADLPDCEAIPLCGHCILHTGCLEPVRTANQAAAIRLCKQAGHPVSADEMCFKLWTALRSPDSQPCSSAAEVRRVLSNPPELVKRLSSLYKEVKLLDERLVLIKSNQDKHFEDLSQVRSGYDVLSRRVTQLDRRFSDFEGNMKESLVPSRFVVVMSSV